MSKITIRPLQSGDESIWRALWSAYLEFYESEIPEEVYAATWQRLHAQGEFEPKGLLALLDGTPVGLVHYLFHRTTWALSDNCYLQDLFTAPEARGQGAGAALIEAVRQKAAARGTTNVYWMTAESNQTARKLYDRVARRTGFIEYDLQ